MGLGEIREGGVFRETVHSHCYVVSCITLMLHPKDVRPEKNRLSSEASASTSGWDVTAGSRKVRH